MGIEGHISESAFLVNASRARSVELSRDRYADLWVTDSIRELWDAFSAEVYPYDEVELGVRNRFFLENLNAFVESGTESSGQPVFVNIGAGFTSYPFLAMGECTWIEVDYEHVVEYKRRRVAEWQKEGVLPKCEINYFAADLTGAADLERLRRFLMPALSGSLSFILMEGITYYLDRSLLERLFSMFRELQCEGSVLTFDFWTPQSATHPVFLRFADFFARRFGHRRKDFTLIDDSFLRSIPGYEVRRLTDVQELERVYSKTEFLSDYEAILPESYAIMNRTR